MTLTEYYDRLEKHDWMYHYTDDHLVWTRGADEADKLWSIGRQSPAHAELYAEFQRHASKGSPKPVRPQETVNG
jgi:hypothetical protein